MFWVVGKRGMGKGFCKGWRECASQEKRIGKGGVECKGMLIQCYQALGLQDCDCLLGVALARDVAILVADVRYVEVLVESAQVVCVE